VATSLRKIAAEAGASLTTVSLALRNDPTVAQATRERIQKIASDLGYRAHPAVTTLMTHIRSQRPADYLETVAWLNPHDDPAYFTDSPEPDYFQSLWLGARKRAAELGYRIDTMHLGAPGMSGRKMSEILASRGIRGVMIAPLPRSIGHLRLEWERFAAVALGYTLTRPRLHRVSPHHHYNVRMLLRNVRRLGFSKPGLLIRPGLDARVDNHFSAAFNALRYSRSEGPVPVLTVEPGDNHAILQWIDKYGPDCVVTTGEFVASRGLKLGRSGRRELPRVALLGIQSVPWDLPGINEHAMRVGAAALDHLAGQLQRNELGIPISPQTVLIEGEWVERARKAN
jgi:DNA-binding LacI/PurR family transcriptional regulator